MIGTIGQAGLNGAGDLAIYIGHTLAQVSSIPGTTWVTSINSAPGQAVFTPFFRYAFGIGVLAVLFPMLVLISTATRLAADRREERFAALRLVGGTPGDIRILAAVESVIGAFLGAVVGTVIFLLVRPALAGAALVGTQYFESDLTPTVAGYAAMLVGVPAAAAIAALVSLRRVQISPLGVARRATPKPPTFWRLIALRGRRRGLRLRAGQDQQGQHRRARLPGPAAHHDRPGDRRPLAHRAGGPALRPPARGSSALLAARRLADNPKRRLPGGDRAHAGGLPRHDGRPDRARRERDRGTRPRPGRSATS